MKNNRTLFTIGHSNHDLKTFIDLLKKHHITAVADVRSHPYSKYLSHFNKDELKEALEKEEIDYIFLGQELGARPNDLNCYIQGKAIYDKIAATDLFKQGLNQLNQALNKLRIALMCAEKDPITCHRTILICQHLDDPNLDINHILSDGNLESHQQLEQRLLNLHGLSEPSVIQLSLFDSLSTPEESTREEKLKKAYQLQGEKIAYTVKK